MKFNQQLVCCLMLFLFSCSNVKNDQPGNQKDAKDSTVAIKDTTASAPVKKKKEAPAWTMVQNTSRVDFTITNFGALVQGSLGGLKGTIHFDEKNLAGSSFDASVKVNTINTGNNMRNKDLMHEKYFDEEHYPEIKFHSDSISGSDKKLVASGVLTIKGKSLHKTIPFTFSQNGNSGVFKSQFTLKRKDFGIGGNGPIMGDDVNVSLEVTATKQ